MAQNILPKTIAELLDLGTHCKAGLGTHGAALGILQYTPANYEPFVAALEARQGLFITARSAFAHAVSDVMAHRLKMREAGLDARLLLQVMLSREWKEAWTSWGWGDSTTEVPRDLPGLKALCLALKTALGAQPDFQIDTAKVQFIPTAYQSLLDDLVPLEAAVTAHKVALGIARDARLSDETNLRRETRGLIDLLGTKIPPESPLWDAFGLNRPSAQVPPAAPAAPLLSEVSGGAVVAQTATVSGTDYYRWFAQLMGVDAEFRFLGRTADPTRVFTDLPAHGTLKVKVEAASAAGPGPASPVTTLALGA